MRCKKNDINYTLDGTRIIKQTDGTNTFVFYYGTNGVVGFNLNGNDYYYFKNIQGDVIAIYDSAGTKVASYIYDAWGRNLKATDLNNAKIASRNPFRYHGYYYDTETSLYYLGTRYYDPEPADLSLPTMFQI